MCQSKECEDAAVPVRCSAHVEDVGVARGRRGAMAMPHQHSSSAEQQRGRETRRTAHVGAAAAAVASAKTGTPG